MDTAEIIVTVTGAALIAFNFWFFFGARDEAPVTAGGATNRKVYGCPMHPWITSTDPAANCSICGMKLVKKD